MAFDYEFAAGENRRGAPKGLAAAYVVAAYNATVHESTGYSPNFLTFGRELAVPVDVALGNPPADRLSVNDYADHLVTSLQEAYCDARKHLGRAAERTKRYYDCKSQPLAFKPGT